MKLIDLFHQQEVLTAEAVDIFHLSNYVSSQSEMKREEEKILKDNERALRLLEEIDNLTNRIFKALADNEVVINGTRYSLATLHYYIVSSEESYHSSVGELVGECDACKVPAFHPTYFNARLNYLQSLDTSRRMVAYDEYTLLVDPLKLHTETKNYYFNFMAEVKNVYLKAIATIDV